MPWEGIWHALAQWFGVSDADTMKTILPNLHRFDPVANHIITAE